MNQISINVKNFRFWDQMGITWIRKKTISGSFYFSQWWSVWLAAKCLLKIFWRWLTSCQTFEGLKITVHSIIEAVSSATSCQICFDRKFLSRPFVKTQISLASREKLVLEKITQAFGFLDLMIIPSEIRRFFDRLLEMSARYCHGIDFTNEVLPCRKKPKKDGIRSCH